VAGVQAGHQHAARGRADRSAGVGIGELEALRCESIEIRRENLPLAVGADVAVTQIVSQDKDDVGLARLDGVTRRAQRNCQDGGDKANG
jgi:hypothetical protein